MARRYMLPIGLVLLLALVATTLTLTHEERATAAGGSFPGQGDDTFTSIGQYRIIVEPGFQSLFTGCPASVWDGVSRLESPLLFDTATRVGRSAEHTHGSTPDTTGTAVGTAGTVISDSDFVIIPGSFDGPAGRSEIHTEIRELNLTNGGVAVRAGTAAPGRPISPGEVEADSGASDLPADSFFNVYVEADLPSCGSFPGATIYNDDPLLIVHDDIKTLPPKVVYKHGNSEPVPVFFLANGASWSADDLFGWLVLAGHGADFDPTEPTDVTEFEDIYATIPEVSGTLNGVFCVDISFVGINGVALIRLEHDYTPGGSPDDVALTAVAYVPDGSAVASCLTPGSLVTAPFTHQNGTRPTILDAFWNPTTQVLSGTACHQNTKFGGVLFSGWTSFTFNATISYPPGVTNAANAFQVRTSQNPGANPEGSPTTCTDSASTITIGADIANGRWLDGPSSTASSFNSDWDGGGQLDWSELDPARGPNVAGDPFNALDDGIGGVGGVSSLPEDDISLLENATADSQSYTDLVLPLTASAVLVLIVLGASFASRRGHSSG